MARTIALLFLILWCTACVVDGGSLPDRPARSPQEQTSVPVPSVFTIDGRRQSLYDASPLGYSAWIDRALEAKVPIFATGTHIAEVVSTLQDWGLRPVVTNDYILVREGPSRHNFKEHENRSMMVYAFDDFQLFLGPLNTKEAIWQLDDDGLSAQDLALLLELQKMVGLNAQSLNNIAWSLATYHDAEFRDGEMAVDFAKRANVMSNWSDLFDLDIVAAAFASKGDFKSAAAFQKLTLIRPSEYEDEFSARLELYESGEAYVQSPPGPDSASNMRPDEQLLAKARGGDATAQYDLAVFYIENDIEETETMQWPGKHWLTLAANNGSEFAIEEMGYANLRGERGFEADVVAARRWLHKADDFDSPNAAYNLGRMYRDAIGVEWDDKCAAHWFAIAAERGDGIAALEMSYRHREGAGVSRSEEQSRRFLELAFENDIDPVIYLMAEDYLRIARVNLGMQVKAFSLQEAAEFPALLMEFVANIEQELEREQRYITMSVAGNVFGWPADHAPKVKLAISRVAATLGSKEAQMKLAEIYATGMGVEPSPAEALYWRERASKNQESDN